MTRRARLPRIYSRVALLTMALVAHLAVSSAPAQADDKGWVLTQKSLMLGDMYLYVSPSGFKFVNPKAGVNFVTRSPNWDVIMFNDRTKVCYSATLDTFKRQVTQNLPQRRDELGAGRWQRGTVSNIANLRATQYVMNDAAGVQARMAARGKKRVQQHLQGADYWVSEEIQVPPQLADLLSAMYGLPNTLNVPLRLSVTTQEQGTKVQLDTYRSQSCPIPISYYSMPSGYRPVKSSVEVMADEDTKQIIDDMSKDLGNEGGGGNNGKPITNEDLDRFLNKFKKR
ncbi:MAG: hypothetical protein IT342_08260 [Candidatus Melainabacteria bacterium]|nr:hypothetical protein [Candidatus Melainabacteria bacterium]